MEVMKSHYEIFQAVYELVNKMIRSQIFSYCDVKTKIWYFRASLGNKNLENGKN